MDLLSITLTGWVTLSIALSMAFLSGLMFILGRERSHYVWGVFCMAIVIWAGGFYMVTLAQNPAEALFWWKISFVGMILNPFLYLLFTLEFIENQLYTAHRKTIGFLLSIVAGCFLVLDLFTNLIINKVTFLFDELYYNTPPGELYLYFMSLFLVLVCFSLFLVFREYRKRTGDLAFRRRALFFFVASLIAYVGGSMNFLPIYGIDVHPTTAFAVACGALLIAYAILRYRLFNVYIVTAQFLTLTLSVFALVRLIFSATTVEAVFNAIIFVVTLVVGIYLIISVRKEIELREVVERLATELEVKNQKLMELDTLKSQFLSIATHELRTPLTIVRNFISLLVDGTYGKVSEAAQEAGRQVFERVTDMTKSVESYLNVSKIEQGKIQYSFVDADFALLVRDAVNNMRVPAEKKGLALSLTIAPGAETLKAKLDTSKMSEVLINIIDNSIKYTPTGSIALTLERVGNRTRLTVVDTGIGMASKTIQNLFKLFSPGEDSKKINPASTGVGLYVSRSHVEAHKGTLTATSAGGSKGSQFVVDIPLA